MCEAADRLLALDTVLDPVREHDHPGAGPEGREPTCDRRAQRLEQVEDARQLDHRGRLATRDDQPVAGRELGRSTYGDRLGTQRSQRTEVLAHVSLEGEHADGRIHERRS